MSLWVGCKNLKALILAFEAIGVSYCTFIELLVHCIGLAAMVRFEYLTVPLKFCNFILR